MVCDEGPPAAVECDGADVEVLVWERHAGSVEFEQVALAVPLGLKERRGNVGGLFTCEMSTIRPAPSHPWRKTVGRRRAFCRAASGAPWPWCRARPSASGSRTCTRRSCTRTCTSTTASCASPRDKSEESVLGIW